MSQNNSKKVLAYLPTSKDECTGCGYQLPENTHYLACVSETTFRNTEGRALEYSVNEVVTWPIKMCNNCIKILYGLILKKKAIWSFVTFTVATIVFIVACIAFLHDAMEKKTMNQTPQEIFMEKNNAQPLVASYLKKSIELQRGLGGIGLNLIGICAFLVSLISLGFFIKTLIRFYSFRKTRDVMNQEFPQLFRSKAESILSKTVETPISFFPKPRFVDFSQLGLSSEQIKNFNEGINSGNIKRINKRKIFHITGYTKEELIENLPKGWRCAKSS